MGIEPTSTAWEAVVLPMNYIRIKRDSLYHKSAKESSGIYVCLQRAYISGAIVLARWPMTR